MNNLHIVMARINRLLSCPVRFVFHIICLLQFVQQPYQVCIIVLALWLRTFHLENLRNLIKVIHLVMDGDLLVLEAMLLTCNLYITINKSDYSLHISHST